MTKISNKDQESWLDDPAPEKPAAGEPWLEPDGSTPRLLKSRRKAAEAPPVATSEVKGNKVSSDVVCKGCGIRCVTYENSVKRYYTKEGNRL
jgi:aldehyde:ferredoxin oxidoreductase